MKRIPGIITAIMLTGVAQAFATDTTTAGPERKLEFRRYDSSYFERNDTALTTQTSYLVFTSRPQFDKIFGPAPTMGQNHFLPDNTFDTKIVVAAIARGHFLRKYDDPKVTATRGMIYVWYKIKDAQQNSATFASPLILAVDKGQYSEVIFMENGTRVGAATFPRTN
jgi:hypothetical protein